MGTDQNGKKKWVFWMVGLVLLGLPTFVASVGLAKGLPPDLKEEMDLVRKMVQQHQPGSIGYLTSIESSKVTVSALMMLNPSTLGPEGRQFIQDFYPQLTPYLRSKVIHEAFEGAATKGHLGAVRNLAANFGSDFLKDSETILCDTLSGAQNWESLLSGRDVVVSQETKAVFQSLNYMIHQFPDLSHVSCEAWIEDQGTRLPLGRLIADFYQRLSDKTPVKKSPALN